MVCSVQDEAVSGFQMRASRHSYSIMRNLTPTFTVWGKVYCLYIRNLQYGNTYFHKYGNYHQPIRTLSSFCDIRVQLMVIVDQLNLEKGEGKDYNQPVANHPKQCLQILPTHWGVCLVCIRILSLLQVLCSKIIFQAFAACVILIISVTIWLQLVQHQHVFF